MRAKPWDVSDGLWGRVEPLLPRAERRFRYPGRKRFDDRRALQGILFVLHTGIGWEHLPQELGFGCGMTCWRRLRAWQEAGVWQRLHELLLAELHARPGRSSGRERSLTPATCKRKKGLANRSQPGRPGPPRQQAASPRRRPRAAAGLVCDGRQPQRRHPTAGVARSGAAGTRPCRPPEATP
jgi:transposase